MGRVITKCLLTALLLCVCHVAAFASDSAPCLRLTEADAGQAFGTPVKRNTTDACRFEAVADPSDYFTLEIQPGQAENSEKLMAPLNKIFGNPDPVSGVGDHAFSFESVLIVLYKKDYFTVSVFSSRLTRQHADLAAAKAIARQVIAVL